MIRPVGTRAGRVDQALLREHCERIARELPIPRPFRAAAFIQALMDHRGRRIELVGMVGRQGTPCGMFVNTPDADYIFYTTNTTLLHQEHIIVHEIGHLLCGHKGTSALHDTVAALLMKNLSAKLIVRVLGRTAYTETEEAEAEMFASVILMRGGPAHAPRQINPDLAEGLDRLGKVFG